MSRTLKISIEQEVSVKRSGKTGKTIFLLATLSFSSSRAPRPEDCIGRWLVRYTTGENNTCQSLLGTSRNDLILDHCVIFSQLRKLAIPIVSALSIWTDAKTLFSFSSPSTTWTCTCTDSEKLLEIKHHPRCWQPKVHASRICLTRAKLNSK